ncbi:MAG TPA: antibiotic biosynthesis monooxygenase family protein [Candidatus Binatia bacterium]|jgi:quinol monooxygenase YgiN
MAIRLIVTITAAAGKGAELAQAFKARCLAIMKEPGCEQFEVFQSVVNPDKLALLERWTDQAALDAHARLHSTLPPFKPDLRGGPTEREDYVYTRTR